MNVYVELKDGAWQRTTATVLPDKTARLPGHGMSAEKWQFPPGTRVRCEWRELAGRPALLAISPAD